MSRLNQPAGRRELLKALEMLTEGHEAAVPEALKGAAAEVEEAHRPWVQEPGVQGFGIGRAIRNGVESSELVLKIYVDEKRPEDEVDSPVPAVLELPGIDSPITTDVEAIGQVTLESNTHTTRPAVPGFSIGHPVIRAGTLGCLVVRTGTTEPYFVLSNSHVLADSGCASKGDSTLQPGPADGGITGSHDLGTLEAWVPFDFSNAYTNLVDAAIAAIETANATSAIHRIGVPAGVSTALRLGMQVRKTGRTTDYTTGIVRDINFRTKISYKRGNGKGIVWFKDQVLCSRFTAGGDSGSAILNNQGHVVGLHFAGSPASSIFNRIEHVLAALGIEVVNWAV